MKKIELFNISFSDMSLDEVADSLMHRTHHGFKVFTPNPEMLLEAQRDPEFAAVLQNSDLNIPDGVGILWAARFLKKGAFSERVTGTDLMQETCKRAAQTGDKVFLLGAAPGVAGGTKEALERRYPGLIVAGFYAGSPRDEDFREVRRRILEAQPDILFVAYGAPAQETWIARHIKEFPSVRFAVGVGGAFDFIFGARKRAPLLMRQIGLEWLYRLVQQPSRIKRIFNAVVRFPLMVIRERGK